MTPNEPPDQITSLEARELAFFERWANDPGFMEFFGAPMVENVERCLAKLRSCTDAELPAARARFVEAEEAALYVDRRMDAIKRRREELAEARRTENE